MVRYIIRKILYGILVLWGVVTVVFFLFHFDPSMSAEAYAGKHDTKEDIQDIAKMYNLDIPVYKQYLLFLNNISPISIHNSEVEDSRIYLDDELYSYTSLFSYSEHRTVVIKYPYLGREYESRELVADRLWTFIPETIILAVFSMGIAIVLGIIFGVLAALYKGSFIDGASLVVSTLGMSAPSFFTGVIILWIGSVIWFDVTTIPIVPFLFMGAGLIIGLVFNRIVARKRFVGFSWAFLGESMFKGFIFGWVGWLVGFAINGVYGEGTVGLISMNMEFPGTQLPSSGTLHDSDDFGDPFMHWQALWLPAITLGIRPLAVVAQLTRSSMLDVMSQDYIRTATAKGLNRFWVIFKHALKNALNPVVTAVSGWFASLLAGAIFVEEIFGWRGVGKATFDAIMDKNIPFVIGAVLVIATFFVVINIVVDIIYGILDPRVRIQ